MTDKLDTSFDRRSSLMLIGWCNAASSWPKAHTAGVFKDLHLVLKKGQLALVLLHNLSSSDGDIYISILKSQCFFSPLAEKFKLLYSVTF